MHIINYNSDELSYTIVARHIQFARIHAGDPKTVEVYLSSGVQHFRFPSEADALEFLGKIRLALYTEV